MKKRWILLLAMVLLLVTVVVGTALASTGGDYELSWWTVDSGGGRSTGGDYAISGTIGQPDAGGMDGGDYAIRGGFWERMVEGIKNIFLPLVTR